MCVSVCLSVCLDVSCVSVICVFNFKFLKELTDNFCTHLINITVHFYICLYLCFVFTGGVCMSVCVCACVRAHTFFGSLHLRKSGGAYIYLYISACVYFRISKYIWVCQKCLTDFSFIHASILFTHIPYQTTGRQFFFSSFSLTPIHLMSSPQTFHNLLPYATASATHS